MIWRKPLALCTRADMGEACAPRLSVANEGNRAPDVAQRPQCEREVQHCPDARVDSEAERKIVVAPGLEQGQRTLDMLPRLEKFSGEPVGGALHAMRDSSLGRIGSRLDVAQEGRGVSPHRRQLAASEAADPKAVVSRQPSERVLISNRLAGSGESSRRFRAPGPRAAKRALP